MIFALLTLILFILGIFLLVKKVQNENRNQNLPPGPWGLPLLGHLPSLGLNPHLTLMKWKEKYGPIISCRLGSFSTIVLCDAKLIKEAYNMVEFSGRPQLQAWVESKADKGILISDGEYNAELRQFATRKLKEFGVGRKTLEDKIHEGIAEFMDFIKMNQGLCIKSENVPSAHFVRTLWSIMVKNELNPEEAEQLGRKLETAGSLGPVLSELAGFMPWLEKLTRIVSFGQFSLIAARSQPLKEFYSFFAKFLDVKKEHRVKGQGQGQMPIDIMDLFLEKVEETTDNSSPFHTLHGAAPYFLGDLFGAAIHTIHITLLWMLNYMARNPEVQKKLQVEIDQVIGNSRLPSVSDRGQMPYADAIVHETLRMSSVTPLAMPHKTTTDVCFHGYTIKKGSMIVPNLYGVHHDPKIWGDAGNFRPERLLGEQGKKLMRENIIPFSKGKRKCPGEAFAREQLFLYVTTLFQEYTVDFPRGKVPKVKGVFGLFLHPSSFSLVFNQRQT